MFFGLFGKTAKSPLDDLKETLESFQKLMDSNKKDKIVLEKFQSHIEKITKILIDDEKTFTINNPITSSTSTPQAKSEALDYFLNNKVMNSLIAYAINDSPEGLVDVVIKSVVVLLKEIKSKHFLTDYKIIEAFRTLIHTLDSLIYEDKLRYTTRILLITFLSELCKKFFVHSEILNLMKIKFKDEDCKIEYEEISVFSILMNIFKTDQLILEYENKKLIRRAIIICLSFEEVAESSYIENESLICEILIEKLCNYYEMLPDYFELSEDLVKLTLEVAPNMKKTFPVLVNTYFEFRDYIFFFNKLCNTLRSAKLKEKLKIILFNKFLVKNVQVKLFSADIRVIRSNLQYLIFILKTMKNTDIINLIFNFIFGFNDSNSRMAYTSKTINSLINADTINEIISNDDNLKDESFEYKQELDYDYQNHENIKIGLCLMNNLANSKDKINIIIITLFETFFEKCPYMTIHKLILPFTEVCLKQMGNTSYLLENKKNYPNIDCFFSLVAVANENKKFQFSEISENLDNNLNRSYLHYINNDIDFYYYYLNQREDQENYQFIDTVESKDTLKEEAEGGIGYDSPNKDEVLVKNEPKFNFNYFTTNTKLKINSRNKLFDDLAEIEEEFKNIHITFMKLVLEKFVNFTNNTYLENLFFTNLIITILTVPCLEFDPVLVLCQSLLLDENPQSNFSFLINAKYITLEIETIIKQNPNFLFFLKVRKEEIENPSEISNPKEIKRKGSKESIPKMKLPSNLLKEYTANQNTLSNIILFIEFLKEFISIIVHKFHFENLVENLYELYSSMLDDYNI